MIQPGSKYSGTCLTASKTKQDVVDLIKYDHAEIMRHFLQDLIGSTVVEEYENAHNKDTN